MLHPKSLFNIMTCLYFLTLGDGPQFEGDILYRQVAFKCCGNTSMDKGSVAANIN